MRIDKFIWCIRKAKTRSIGNKMVESGKVLLNKEIVKTHKLVIPNDHLSIKDGPIWRIYKVLEIPKSRVGAKILNEFIIETTPTDQLELLNEVNKANQIKAKFSEKGRPSKKDRRDWEKLNLK